MHGILRSGHELRKRNEAHAISNKGRNIFHNQRPRQMEYSDYTRSVVLVVDVFVVVIADIAVYAVAFPSSRP